MLVYYFQVLILKQSETGNTLNKKHLCFLFRKMKSMLKIELKFKILKNLKVELDQKFS